MLPLEKTLPGRCRVRPSRCAGGYVTLVKYTTHKLRNLLGQGRTVRENRIRNWRAALGPPKPDSKFDFGLDTGD